MHACGYEYDASPDHVMHVLIGGATRLGFGQLGYLVWELVVWGLIFG